MLPEALEGSTDWVGTWQDAQEVRSCSSSPGENNGFTLHDICRGTDSKLGKCTSNKQGDRSEDGLHG